jgi:cytochrome c
MKTHGMYAALVAIALACSGSAALAAIDAEAAQALARKSGCLKCHAVDKEKKGPSFAKTSAKLKGKAEALDEVIKMITTGPKVKFDDGSEEEHKIVKSDNKDEIRNLAEWILSH